MKNPDTGESAEKNSSTVRRAMISVSDKSGLAEFAAGLEKLGVEIYSTGGTARHLKEANIGVKDVAEYTNFPEMMDGRVKTLHPMIFGGILCRRDNPEDMDSIGQHGILPFDLVVVNLYPFAETIARPDCDRATAIENIDIGGPSLVRAAAKNSQFVTIATSPSQYPAILDEVRSNGQTSQTLRSRLMAAAFRHTAEYDVMIADYFASNALSEIGSSQATENSQTSRLPDSITMKLIRAEPLRYGENSHQAAALYKLDGEGGTSLASAKQLNGKGLSFNNLLDLNTGLTMVSSFQNPACVVLKHNNPCGAAVGNDLADIFERAFNGDPISAFGSIVATNREVDLATAEFLSSGNFFVEAILAPGFTDDALNVLKTKPKWKRNVRLVTCPLAVANPSRLDMRRVHGGLLVQQADDLIVDATSWKTATGDGMDEAVRGELAFAWNMVRFVKSNAIVLGKEQSLVGVGAGQMSRVDSVRIAIEKAGERAAGSVLASDAFFPFPDSIEIAATAGIAAIIQPGGSVKDPEVIAACQQYNIPMILTDRRHFLH